jgi:hypothetical protein
MDHRRHHWPTRVTLREQNRRAQPATWSDQQGSKSFT